MIVLIIIIIMIIIIIIIIIIITITIFLQDDLISKISTGIRQGSVIKVDK